MAFLLPSWQKMEEIPFGISFFPLGSPLWGMLIQFAINKPKYDDDYDEDEDLGKVPERRQKREEADWEEVENETKAQREKKSVMIKRILPGSSTESIRKSMKMMI